LQKKDNMSGRRPYSLVLINAAACAAGYFACGGLNAPLLILLMAINLLSSLYFRADGAWLPSAIFSYSYLIIFAYIVSNFYYIDIFNLLCFTASIMLILYSYFIDKAFMVFFFLMLAQISALNIYFDYFNINALYSGLNALGEIILMPLIFIPLILAAFYHKLKSETAYSGAYLTVLIMGLSFYLFMVNLNPASGAVALLGAGFVLAFAVFILPSGAAGPSEKQRGSERDDGTDNGGEVFERAETGVICRSAAGFSGAVTLNFIMIFIASAIYAYSFYHINHSDTTFEFYSRGASLYHDAAAGYYARFNAPFANISVKADTAGASKIYGRKNFKVSPLPPREINLNDKLLPAGFYINAAASDVKAVGDNLKSVTFDYPFLNILIDEKKAASISPRFVYKLEAGVNKDGSSVLKNYELAGDRFIMLDESNPYNKFGTQAKNFFAVSGCASFAAIYDFSGNVRVVGASDSKTVMVISGLKEFKSVASYGSSDFLILCGASLYKVLVLSKAVECLLVYDNNAGGFDGGFKDLCSARRGQAVIACGDKSLIMRDGGFERLPPVINLNDSNRAVYYDGEILACCDYFSQTLNLYKIKKGSPECEIMASSVYKLLNSDSTVKLISCEGKAGPVNIVAAEFSLKENTVTLNEFDRNRLSLIRSVKINIGGGIKDFNLSANKKTPLIIAASEDSARIIKSGYFYDDESYLTLDSFYEHNAGPPLPSKLEIIDNTAFWAAHNRIYIIDLTGKKVNKILEAAR
jgi:hypothetical protein